MKPTSNWIYIFACCFLWSGLNRFFVFAEKSWEPKLLDTGLGFFWWLIVLAYFIADAGLILAFMYSRKLALGLPIPPGFPFWTVGADAVMSVFLLHLSFSCLDNRVYIRLDGLGLSDLYVVFLIVASLWLVVTRQRYRALRKMYLLDDKAHFSPEAEIGNA
jgi:hypothetical protein